MANAALIGTGWISHLHAQALRALGIEISTVIGHSEESARLFAQKWEIPRFGTELDLLDSKEVDCVHICTPPKQHYAHIRSLLAYGKHILCEKPLCLDPQEARELSALAQNAGLVCAVGFNVRYYLACRKARQLVQSADFGAPLLLHGSYLQEFGASPAQWSWRYEDKLHAVTEIGSHWLDLAQYLSGKKIVAVSAQLDRFHPLRYLKDGTLYNTPTENANEVEVPSEDVAIISLRFEDGAIGNVVLSELSHGRGNDLTIEITGEKQTLWWQSQDHTQLHLAQKGQPITNLSFADSFESTFAALIGNVYRCIEDGAPADYPTFTEAKENVLICEAIWQSANHNSHWTEVEK